MEYVRCISMYFVKEDIHRLGLMYVSNAAGYC